MANSQLFFQGWAVPGSLIPHQVTQLLNPEQPIKIIAEQSAEQIIALGEGKDCYQELSDLVQQPLTCVAYSFGLLVMMQWLSRLVAQHPSLVNNLQLIIINASPYGCDANYGVNPKVAQLTLKKWQQDAIQAQQDYFANCLNQSSLSPQLLELLLKSDATQQISSLNYFIEQSAHWQQLTKQLLPLLQQAQWYGATQDRILSYKNLNKVSQELNLQISFLEQAHLKLTDF